MYENITVEMYIWGKQLNNKCSAFLSKIGNVNTTIMLVFSFTKEMIAFSLV